MSKVHGLLALTLALVIVVAPASRAANADSGLLVTKISGSQWQVRLIAGPTSPQSFKGLVTATHDVSSFATFKLESTDDVRITADKSLSIDFDASVGSLDGTYFWTPATSQICLRNTGGTPTKVFRGSTLASAVQVSFPVSLQGENPCGTTPPTGPYLTTRKFHPGHYTSILRVHTLQKYMDDALRPGVVGIVKRYTWRDLEPTPGNYAFSSIRADLAWARAYGMQLIIRIEDKTFTLERPTPAYLDAYTVRNRNGGYTVLRWNSYVVSRWKALMQALGQFDADPRFEGIQTQESSLAIPDSVLAANGYSPEKYRDAYIAMFESALASLPKSRVFWSQNFIVGNQSYVGEVAKAVGPKGVVMGAVDVLPDDASLVTKSYPYFTQFLGKMHLAAQVEGASYRALHKTSGYSTKYWTMPELFRYARDQLHVNYLFWLRIPVSTPSDSYNWTDALPVMQANQTFNEEW